MITIHGKYRFFVENFVNSKIMRTFAVPKF